MTKLQIKEIEKKLNVCKFDEIATVISLFNNKDKEKILSMVYKSGYDSGVYHGRNGA